MAFTHAMSCSRWARRGALCAGLTFSAFGVLTQCGCSSSASTKSTASAQGNAAASAPEPSPKAKAANTKGAPARPERDPSAPAAYSSAATDLQSLFDDMKKQGEVSVSPENTNAPANTSPPQTPELALDRVGKNPPAPAPTPAPTPAPQASVGMLVSTTVVAENPPNSPALSQGADSKAPEPAPAAVPLDNVQPESAPAEASQTQTAHHPAAQSQTKASPRAKTPRDARELDSIAGALTPEQQVPPAPRPGFAIGTTALCSRVESFGRFTPLPSTKFIAGKPALMILYTELSGFSQTESTYSDSTLSTDPLAADAAPLRIVELAQQVELLLDSDGSRQFLIPEQLVRDSSRTSRKDFFVVQRVELPRNLSVGKYNLKVTVRDVASGAIAERITPITIIADPNLTSTREGGVLPPGVITPETASERDGLRLPNKPKPSKTR